MKVTIELTQAEVDGIKDYLKEVDHNQKPSKQDIVNFIDGIVQATLQSQHESVNHYITERCKQ